MSNVSRLSWPAHEALKDIKLDEARIGIGATVLRPDLSQSLDTIESLRSRSEKLRSTFDDKIADLSSAMQALYYDVRIKKPSSMEQKNKGEKKPVSKILDPLAATIYFDDTKRLSRGIDKCLLPQSDSSILYTVDDLRRPSKDASIPPRFRAIIQIKDALSGESLLTEVFAVHAGMEETMKKTHDLYVKSRGIDRRIAELDARSNDLERLIKLRDRFDRERENLHKRKSKSLKLPSLYQNRVFAIVENNGFAVPLMLAASEFDREVKAVVPTLQDGRALYIPDNHYLRFAASSKTEKPNFKPDAIRAGIVIPITRADFVRASAEFAVSGQYRPFQKEENVLRFG